MGFRSLRVTTATSTAKRRGLLAGTSFGCVVSDYDMPGENAPEFLETVRETTPRLPFLVYTGEATLVVDTGLTVNVDPGRFRQPLESLVHNTVGSVSGGVTVTLGPPGRVL